MKFFMMSADKRGTFDPPSWQTIRQMEGRVDSIAEADVICLVQTKHPEFEFNDRLADEIGDNHPWVFFDWTETNWDWDQKETMFFGQNTEKFFGDSYNEHWRNFDEFVRDRPPILTFKRELLEKDRAERVLPLEYLSWLPDHGMDTKEDFAKRPLEVMSAWGRSHEARMLLHGSIFTQAGRLGYDVISEFSHIEPTIKDSPASLKWATVHAPHFARIAVEEVQKFNLMARVVVSLPGCGWKTFRTGEVACDAIMAMPSNRLAWSYPWTAENSIVLPPIHDTKSAEEACKVIRDALMRPDLYELYGAARENSLNYAHTSYLRRHVKANIERCL